MFIPTSWKLPPGLDDVTKEPDKDYWTKKIIGVLGLSWYNKLKFVFDRRII